MTHRARGRSSLATKSRRSVVPLAPSDSRVLTASALMSYTTQWCPSRMSRRTRFAPIRPSPIIPSCIGLSVGMEGEPPRMSALLERTVMTDERVGGRVVVQAGLLLALQLRDDGHGKLLTELDAPLVERVDAPDRPLGEHAVLVQRHQGAEHP